MLPVSFFRRPAEVVAEELIGAVIVSSVGGVTTAGRIVETEAYLGVDDPASHAFGGRRHAQNESIYGPPATWYVYRSYGVHWCANMVCAEARTAAAVLLRAVQPLEGLDHMRHRRGGVADPLLASGPGRLTVALGIDRRLDGSLMRESVVQLYPGESHGVVRTPRIGITRAVDWPLRFHESRTSWASRASRG